VAIYLGIDGGGTKTTCAVGDDVATLSSATAGGSNIIRSGQAQARESLHQAIKKACTAAKVDPKSVAGTCIGVAGAARREVSETIRRLISEVVSGEVEVVGDMVIALDAAFGDGPGVIVLAGTGSIAYGRDAEGRTARAGGWGFAISDEGSGHWIGRAAVAAAMRAQDTNQKSDLLAAILSAWKLGTIDDLVRKANASPPPDFSGLLPPVLSTAEAGDQVAHQVLAEAARELAVLAKRAIGQLFPADNAVPVAMGGGVFRRAALVRDVFRSALEAECPLASIEPAVVEPVKGALRRARRAAKPGR
jgi:glucosamine kinase